MGGLLGGAVFALQRRLGLFESDQIRAWRIVNIGAGVLAGALMFPAAKLLGDLVLPRGADADGPLVRLAIAAGILATIFAPHAVAAWWLLGRSRLETRVSWVGAAVYAVILYLLPAAPC